MPKTYNGTNGVDIVKQNNQHDYFNIFTYGGADQISLTLNQTYVEAGSGNDVVKSNIEFQNDVYLGAGDDTYTGNGFTNNGNRWDKVLGEDGNDTFNISTNLSKYYGGDGNDTFNSVGFENYINGGSGVDTVSYLRQDNDPDLSGFGVSIDLADETAYTGGNRVEVLLSIENAKGTSFADDVLGDNGNNSLWGMNGADIVDGRGGNDKLYGGNGNDDLYGGGSADKLIGGRGNDFLWGGTGADHFIFESIQDSVVGSKRDVIKDFYRSENDKIDLSAIDAVKGGGDDAFDFIGTQAFHDVAGELRFKNGLLQGDVDGDGKADFEVRVADFNTMNNGDFIL
jgi:serralysin